MISIFIQFFFLEFRTKFALFANGFYSFQETLN
jgi:hypothetical protein